MGMPLIYLGGRWRYGRMKRKCLKCACVYEYEGVCLAHIFYLLSQGCWWWQRRGSSGSWEPNFSVHLPELMLRKQECGGESGVLVKWQLVAHLNISEKWGEEDEEVQVCFMLMCWFLLSPLDPAVTLLLAEMNTVGKVLLKPTHHCCRGAGACSECRCWSFLPSVLCKTGNTDTRSRTAQPREFVFKWAQMGLKHKPADRTLHGSASRSESSCASALKLST